MAKLISIIILYCLLMYSCITPKESRVLKRTTKEWRTSPIALEAWFDSPMAGVFLTLRENHKFEKTSSGIIQSFESGTWMNSQDTIVLNYLDGKQKTLRNQTILIDRKTSTLICEGDSNAVYFRFRIMVNKL